ncbi:MFS transporter [Simiduia sp. 21SJ11W-1]|uniref:MFS transporter n=1 Tax=Simiduia sp. 21SJ11W-1 TaxID=2909669 RepID=UPI0020A01141|nr:MFS transporter [Simiduia sp. 21SJ11W-1]UTA48385.1 MFS transporter [Simiduia sp. 21SJ11W-1]
MRTTPNHWQSLTSLLFIAVMGASILTLLPLWVGALSDAAVFNQQQIGWLAAADVMGIFAATVSGLFWVRRIGWRLPTLAGLGVFFIANLLSLGQENFALLMITRVLAGLGCGTAYAIALASLGDHRRPDFAFGLMVTAQVAFGTLGFFVVPGIIDSLGVAGFFHYLNGWLILALVACAVCMPVSQKPTSTSDVKSLLGLFNLNAVLVFSAVVIYYCGVSAVWAYLERMGVALGLDGQAVGSLLGTGFAISGLGSLAAPWVAQRLGKSLAYAGATLVQIAAMLLLLGDDMPLSVYGLYAGSTIVFQFFWSFAVPLLMDQFNKVDATGRLIVLCASAFKVGEVAGPPMAAALINGNDYSGVIGLGAGCMLASIALVLLVEARTTKVALAPSARHS